MGADGVGGQLRGGKDRVPLQWRNQFWHSLEEDAGKRCSPESEARSVGRRPGHGINSLLLLIVLTDRRAISRQLRPLRQDSRQRDFAICLRRFKKGLGEGLAKWSKVKCFAKPTPVNLRTPVSATYCRHDPYQSKTGRW